MNPLALAIYVSSMCSSTLTIAQIKTRLLDVKTSALSNPDSPARRQDVAWYCDQVTAAIVNMEAGVPAWSPAEIKQQIGGSISSLISN